MPRAFIIASILALVACSPHAPKATAPNASSATATAAPAHASAAFVNAEGVAIGGYDPVSFFENAPAEGDPALFTDRDGARYLFATAAHKAAFDADPAKYEPQYGGFCAYGASQGHKATTKPETGQVIDGKLYFNYNLDVKKKFDQDHAGYIAKADENWDKIKDDKPVG